MSLYSFSFSHRKTERQSLGPAPIESHEFRYTQQLLSYMFSNPSLLVEMGGIPGLAYALRTDTAKGLLVDEAASNYQRRTDTYGTNHYPLPPVTSFWLHSLHGFREDIMVQVLTVAGIVSIITGLYLDPGQGWIEGTAILFCVAVVIFVGAYQNYTQEVECRDLTASLTGSDVTVVRNSELLQIPQQDLFVGDIVFLNPGNMIPADGVLVDNTTIKVNESALTGEPDEKVKDRHNPYVFAGTEISDGSCAILVTAVGIHNAKGKIMASLAIAPERTQLQKRLASSEKVAGIVGLISGLLTFGILLFRWLATGPDFFAEWSNLITFIITSITVVIVAVPEGLPLAVTISLAFSMNKMRDDQNLVKVLSACETMGNCTTVCSDKTGTLTQNRMKVVATYLGQQLFEQQPVANDIAPKIHSLLFNGVILNSDKRIDTNNMDFTVAPESWIWQGEGGATDTALCGWISRYYNPHAPITQSRHNPEHLNPMEKRAAHSQQLISFYPFSSAKKQTMAVLGDIRFEKDEDQEERMVLPSYGQVFVKGAADMVAVHCSHMLNANGDVIEVPWRDATTGRPSLRLSQEEQLKLQKEAHEQAVAGKSPQFDHSETHPMKILDQMTRQGLRCIAIIYVENVPITTVDGQVVQPNIEQILSPKHVVGPDAPAPPRAILVGFAGIKDPLRPTTKGSVTLMQHAGIVVRMVTGDNLNTARFIAQECGIISSPHHVAVEGSEFRRRLEENEKYRSQNGHDDDEFVTFVRQLRVMARCHPQDKLELVQFLKGDTLNECVAVTGDGSNDAPALKASNVGLAMGISGTDVSKAAADIIILDDNFSSICRAVMWGRNIYDSIRKFLQFQLSVNLSALILTLVALPFGREPFQAMQLLWVNLIMDTAGSLAIGSQPPTVGLLDRRPYTPNSPLLSKIMYRNIIGQSFFQLCILLTFIFYGHELFFDEVWTGVVSPINGQPIINYDKLNTFIFNTFVFMQLANEFNSRNCNAFEFNPFEALFDTLWFPILFVISVVAQFFVVQLGGDVMQCVPLGPILWFASIIFGASQLITGFLLKLVPIDPYEGQIDLDVDYVFQGAEWLERPEAVDEAIAAFQLHGGSSSSNNSSSSGSLPSSPSTRRNSQYVPFSNEEETTTTTTTELATLPLPDVTTVTVTDSYRQEPQPQQQQLENIAESVESSTSPSSLAQSLPVSLPSSPESLPPRASEATLAAQELLQQQQQQFHLQQQQQQQQQMFVSPAAPQGFVDGDDDLLI